MSTKHTVTLPDGELATRTSASRTYTHAVAVGPYRPEAYRAQVAQRIAETEKRIAASEAAIANPVVLITSRNFGPGAAGFHTHVVCLQGLRRHREDGQHASSEGLVKDTIDWVGQGKDAIMPARAYLVAAARRDVDEYLKPRLAAEQALLEAIDAGTADLGGWFVSGWAGRPDLASKAQGTASSQYAGRPVILLEAAQQVK